MASTNIHDNGTGVESPLDARLRERIEGLLPWIDRLTGKPVGMWVDEVGMVTSEFEPVRVGDPYVDICAIHWDAAEAIQDALREIARIDEAQWIAGWSGADGVKRIRIYPLVTGAE
jgi:hypothetical protein